MENKKKILIATGIYPPDIGGPATYSKILFDELTKRGYDVKVLSFGKVRHFPKIIRHFIYFFKILKKAKGVDIIYAQDAVSVGLPAMIASKLLGKVFILKIVGDYAWEQGKQRFGIKDNLDDFLIKKYKWPVQFLRLIEKIVAKQAKIIITPSKYLKSVVIKWGLPESRVKIIYNAVKNINIKKSKEEIRREKAIAGNIIISVGRMVKWKGFGVLIKIMPKLQDIDKKFKLFIIGDGPEKENLKKMVKENSIKNVIFLGQLNQTELWLYMKAADYFVLNTNYEGLSHIIIEAQQLGLPIITTKVGGNPELIKDGFNGILVKYNNEEQIKNAILKLWKDKKLCEKFIKNSKEKLKKFNLDKMIENTLKILIN